jgi:CO/xanthine dehydrogenase FAD-binding subunit
MTSIFVPIPPPRSGASYKHLSARGKVDISGVCVGAMVTLNGEGCQEARIVLGAVAPTPIRAKKAEGLLQGQPWTSELVEKAGDMAAKASKPISDVRASGAYRKEMVSVLTRRALEEAHERAISHQRSAVSQDKRQQRVS